MIQAPKSQKGSMCPISIIAAGHPTTLFQVVFLRCSFDISLKKNFYPSERMGLGTEKWVWVERPKSKRPNGRILEMFFFC